MCSNEEKLAKVFANDDFNRINFARRLNIIVEKSELFVPKDESMVMAINSPWGTGKSFFIREWAEYLKLEEYNVIEYNAWEADDWDNAFIPILDKIINEYAETDAAKQETLKKLGGNLAKYLFKQTGKFVLDKFDVMIIDIVDEVIDHFSQKNEKDLDQGKYKTLSSKIKKLVTDLFSGNQEGALNGLSEYISSTELIKIILKKNKKLNIVSEYHSYTKTKEAFIKHLKGLSSRDNKTIFIIDELDRCRPDFAIKTLEVIKHFFDSGDIIFVFAIDMEQLKHSIATMYGQNMDSEGYLKRFMTLEISLPNSYEKEGVRNVLKKSLIVKETDLLFDFGARLNFSLRDYEFIGRMLTVWDANNNIELDYNKRQFYYLLIILKYKYNDDYKEFLYGFRDRNVTNDFKIAGSKMNIFFKGDDYFKIRSAFHNLYNYNDLGIMTETYLESASFERLFYDSSFRISKNQSVARYIEEIIGRLPKFF